MRSLAFLGGDPLFAEKIIIGRPNVGDRAALMTRLDDMFDRQYLTNRGPLVFEFEAKLRAFLGVKHCITVCNATIGLEIAARAVGLSGEVIVPSFTFVASAQALRWIGIEPVFCDADPDTHNLDPRHLESLITPRTTGIMPVHVWGRPCDTEAIERIAAAHNLPVLYDAAHAFGCTHRGKMIGNFGAAEVFSFHATKFFNTFEGGAIATNDDALASRILAMSRFGQVAPPVSVIEGTNAKMSEVCAAMGLTSFERLETFVEVNRTCHDEYRRGLAGLPGLRFTAYDDRERTNFQYAILEVDETRAGLSRNELEAVLAADNVITRRYFDPACHQMDVFRDTDGARRMSLATTEMLASRCMSLPTGASLREGDATRICELIQRAVASLPALRSRFDAR